MAEIPPEELKPLLTDGSEIAFIDVREAGQFGEGHPFFAINIPYSRLELRVERLIPRKTAPVVVMDAGDGRGLAEIAAERLEALGYTDVRVMAGGAAGWAEAGYTLYKGVNLPSKAFGELVEHAAHTPHISAADLHAMQERGDPLVLLDGRPPGEYARMAIPGSRSCPNAELGHRLPALVKNKKTPVVVNCAGRTRSIIGAQSLINLGIENPVYALENGTQGWELAGFSLDRGRTAQPLPDLGKDAAAQSKDTADGLIDRFGIPVIGLDAFHDWQDDTGHTVYVFDVRTGEEYGAGHLPGAVHAPGGQLVQATDLWVAVRGARIVLCDDTRLRAAQTALWLRRMGHDAHILREDVTALPGLEEGGRKGVEMTPSLDPCGPAELAGRLAQGAVLLDVRPSMTFRAGHIAGARWAIRPELGTLGLEADDDIIFAGERNVAELAAIDLRDHDCETLAHLEGGPEDWKAAGLEFVESPDSPPDEACIDYLFFVHDRHDGNMEAARGYLDWETALTGQLDEQERGVFQPEF